MSFYLSQPNSLEISFPLRPLLNAVAPQQTEYIPPEPYPQPSSC